MLPPFSPQFFGCPLILLTSLHQCVFVCAISIHHYYSFINQCYVIEYLYSTSSRYLLRGTLCAGLYDAMCHYERKSLINKIKLNKRKEFHALIKSSNQVLFVNMTRGFNWFRRLVVCVILVIILRHVELNISTKTLC